jgi:hypothetical protein
MSRASPTRNSPTCSHDRRQHSSRTLSKEYPIRTSKTPSLAFRIIHLTLPSAPLNPSKVLFTPKIRTPLLCLDRNRPSSPMLRTVGLMEATSRPCRIRSREEPAYCREECRPHPPSSSSNTEVWTPTTRPGSSTSIATNLTSLSILTAKPQLLNPKAPMCESVS